MKHNTPNFITSLGAPFALVSWEEVKNWKGATENEGKHYDALLDIVETLEIKADTYNILQCKIDNVNLTVFDSASTIYKLSEKHFFQLESIKKGVQFSDLKINSAVANQHIEVDIPKGKYVLFDSAFDDEEIEEEGNYYTIELDSDINSITVEHHNSEDYSGWDIKFNAKK